jgi:SAM-dependent methyltransferase
MTAWWEELFDQRYFDFYEGLLAERESADEAAFLDRALGLRPAASLLDLGCGFGRHAVPLARCGYRVTGIDLSADMLGRARRLADAAGVTVDWQRRDMRDLAGLGPFDGAVCLYTVLGFFDDADNARVVHGLRAVLRPGARLVLDVTNPLALLGRWPHTSRRETSRGVAEETTGYDPLTGRVTMQSTLVDAAGRRTELPTSVVRMYPPHELGALLAAAGFEVEALFGALADRPFRWKRSVRQVWVARAVG